MSDEKSEKKRKLTNEPIPGLESTTGVASTHSFFPPGRIKNKDITKGVIQYLRENKYEQLKQELSARGFLETGQIEIFFQKKGGVILSWALMDAPTDEPLRFLTDKNSIVPKNILQMVLEKENFSVFQTFLYAEVGFEQIKKSTPALRELRIKKFHALLNIDNEAITQFMESNQHFQVGSIMKDFQTAKERIQETTSTSHLDAR